MEEEMESNALSIDRREYETIDEEVSVRDASGQGGLHVKVSPLVGLAKKAGVALTLSSILYEKLPARVAYRPLETGVTPGAADAHDFILIAGTLSAWKTLRTLKASTRAWTSPAGPHSFDPFLAVPTVRAALEEVARTHYALEALESKVSNLETTKSDQSLRELTELLETLANNEENIGVPSISGGIRAMINNAITEGQIDLLPADAGENLYSYLSSLAHPQGPSRNLLRMGGAASRQGHWLLQEPSRYAFLSARVACLAGVTASGMLVHKHWKRFVALSERLDAVYDFEPERLSKRLYVPPVNWHEYPPGSLIKQWRDNLWTHWDIDPASIAP